MQFPAEACASVWSRLILPGPTNLQERGGRVPSSTSAPRMRFLFAALGPA